ncbi:hypothetical protein GCM10010169_49180 [Micromonospora fulviviridis]|nr:hypothetical protein GCM10010169_49180 [Micromonospora fulviviridis]
MASLNATARLVSDRVPSSVSGPLTERAYPGLSPANTQAPAARNANQYDRRLPTDAASGHRARHGCRMRVVVRV